MMSDTDRYILPLECSLCSQRHFEVDPFPEHRYHQLCSPPFSFSLSLWVNWIFFLLAPSTVVPIPITNHWIDETKFRIFRYRWLIFFFFCFFLLLPLPSMENWEKSRIHDWSWELYVVNVIKKVFFFYFSFYFLSFTCSNKQRSSTSNQGYAINR